MKRYILSAFTLIMFICSVVVISAQEVLIPIYMDKNIEAIDSKLEEKLSIFPEYSDFQEAKLFQVTDSTFVLEITYKQETKTLKQRLPYTLKDVDELQQKLIKYFGESMTQEEQISFDSDGKIQFIDKALGKKLDIFSGYSNFLKANLYQQSEEAFILEVSYKPKGKLMRQRLPYSIEDLEKLRKEIDDLGYIKPEIELDKSGRTVHISSNMLISMGYYGWALPVILDMDTGRKIAASYLLTSAAGFSLPLIATRN